MGNVHVGREGFLAKVKAFLDHVGFIGFVTELNFFLEVQLLLKHVISVSIVPVCFILFDKYFLDDHAVVRSSCSAIHFGGQPNMIEVA